MIQEHRSLSPAIKSKWGWGREGETTYATAYCDYTNVLVDEF